MMLSNCHRLPCFVSWRIVKMSSPNLNIVTLLGSGLTYASAYLFGIQEQSLLSGDSVEKLIQVSRLPFWAPLFWDGCLHTCTHVHAHTCMYVHACTCSLLAAACRHLAAGRIQAGCSFHIHKMQPDAFCLNGLCCLCKPQPRRGRGEAKQVPRGEGSACGSCPTGRQAAGLVKVQ